MMKDPAVGFVSKVARVYRGKEMGRKVDGQVPFFSSLQRERNIDTMQRKIRRLFLSLCYLVAGHSMFAPPGRLRGAGSI
jgi:hypothetical protein